LFRSNCGPLLIAKEPLSAEDITKAKVAIPGKYTTANFLFGLAYPQVGAKLSYLFSDIEDAVLNAEVDAGLIIHENRFTYQEKGLVKLADMGEYWEENTGMPIPLGGIVIKRDLPLDVKQKVDRVLAKSVTFAMKLPDQTMTYVRQYAQAMEDSVMQAHIGLYVNKFTADLGEEGRAAVERLFLEASAKNLVPTATQSLILEQELIKEK
ncbi:MAG: MqnA/MqnD/SBP family protein, partial [Bacteroidota bacterium]